MADTGQGIDVGDAVLTFLGDTTQLDLAFDRVATQAEVKMAAAAGSVSQIGDAADDAGTKLGVAGQSAGVAGEKIAEGMGLSRRATMEARGEAMLLGEAFGIHLPRHVSRFVAELPGIGTALSAAFSATAVLFLIEALVKGSEKLSEWISNSFIFTQAMKDSDASTVKFNETLEKLGEETAKHQKTFDGFGKSASTLAHETLAELTKALADNQKAFEAAKKTATEYALADSESFFQNMEARIALINRWLGVELDADEIAALAREEFDKQGLAAQEMAILKAKEGADLKIQIANAARDAAVKDAEETEAAAKKSASIAETIGQAKIKTWAALAGYEALFAKNSAEAVLKVRHEQAEKEYQLKLQTLERERAAEQQAEGSYRSIGDEAAATKQVELVKETNAKIEALNAEHYQKTVEQLKAANDEFATAAVAAAKLAYDAQLDSIEKFKKAQLDAYVAGKTGIGAWEEAQIHAVDAAAIAHEDYLKKIIAVYIQQGEAQKANTAQQELAALTVEIEAKATEKLSAAMAKLTSETKSATEAEQKLAEDRIEQHFKDQEVAITKLAAMHLITEQQKDDRLKLLEQQQANAAIKILDDELKAEEKLRDQAAAKLATAKANPASTSSELTELQAELQKEVAAVAKAEDEKLKAQEKFNQQSEANDKSHYGRSLLEAMGFGNELLAEQLKQNHAALLAAENEEKQAKARGQNTAAIKKEIDALKENEKALEKEANGSNITRADKLKYVQAAVASAQAALAEARAHGQDTTALQRQVTELQQLEKVTLQVTSGDKALLAAMVQVNKTQLLAAQDVLADTKARGQDTTAIEKQIADLKKLQTELRQEATELPKVSRVMTELKTSTQQAAETMLNSFAQAMAGMISGQESFGKAMEKATLSMLGQLAQHWAMYYMGLAIGNMFTDPAAAAEEFAAAAALEAISGLMSGLSSGGSGGGGGVSPQGPQGGTVTWGGTGGSGSQQTGGVTKLAAGGIVSKPTEFIAGDSPSGGEAEEAILPLSDSGVMAKIAKAIAAGGQPQAIPEQGFDSGAIERMTQAIAALSGTRNPAEEFHFAEPSTAERPGFQFAGSTASEKPGFSSGAATVGEALGFSSSPSSANEKREVPPITQPGPTEKPGFSFAKPSGPPGPSPEPQSAASGPAISENKPFSASSASPESEKPGFDHSPGTVGEALGFRNYAFDIPSEKAVFQFAEKSPTSPEAAGFTSGEPAHREKSSFDFAAFSETEKPGFQTATAPTVGEALGFTSAKPSESEKPRFETATAAPSKALVIEKPAPQSVGESLGFTSGESTASAKPGFSVSQPSSAEKSGFAFATPSETEAPALEKPAPQTVGEALGFAFSQPTASERRDFTASAPASPAALHDSFTSGVPSESHFPEFSATRPTVGEALGFTQKIASASEKAGFEFAQKSPTVHEASGFTSGEPAPGEKPSFSFAEPSESEKAQFLAAQPSVSEKPGFQTATSPTVGEALGFKFDTPYPGEKPVFSSGTPSAPEKPGFALAAPSGNQQRDFEAASPSTVGEALGFNFSAPRTSYEGLGFTSGQPSATATRGFASGVPSPHEKQPLDIAPSSPGERPGYDFSAPSLPREMPDMESLAAHLGGLLSQPTLRAASDSQVPTAAVAASPAATPMDIEARMERFAEKLTAQITPPSTESSAPQISVHVKGLMDSGNLKKIIAKQNRMVHNRQATIKASDSLRITRRSQ